MTNSQALSPIRRYTRVLAAALVLVLTYLCSVSELYHVRLHPRLLALQGHLPADDGAALQAVDSCPLCELATTSVTSPTQVAMVWGAVFSPPPPPLVLSPATLCSLPATPTTARGPPPHA